MKRFRELIEERLNEGSYGYPADDMTMKEVKVACYAAQKILDMMESGAMVQRWQISAIVKAAEELTSVYTSMSADEEEFNSYDDEEEWDGEEEPMYVGFEYPSMYESTELDEISMEKIQKVRDRAAKRVALSIGKTEKNPETGLNRYIPATDDEMALAKKGMKSFIATGRAITRKSAAKKRNEEAELDEAKLERGKNTVGAHHLERDSGDHKMYTAYTGSLVRRLHTVTDKDDNILGQGSSAASAMAKAKLKKPHRDALMHDDNQIVKVHDTRSTQNVGTQVATPGKGKWFKDHEEAMKYAKSLPGKIRHADPKTGHVD